MKILKRIAGLVLAVCLVAAAAIPDTAVYAKVHTPPKSLIIGPKTESGIYVHYVSGEQLKNIKTDSKNLIARQTVHSIIDGWPGGHIGLYAKKAGTYNVTFDIYQGDTKARSYSVKVYARDYINHPVKKAVFAGKTKFDGMLTDKKNGIFRVTLDKHYKLTKIEAAVYNKKGERVSRKIKNGAKITLGKYAKEEKQEYKIWGGPRRGPSKKYWTKEYNKDLLADTEITVSFKRKGTKDKYEAVYHIYRIPQN